MSQIENMAQKIRSRDPGVERVKEFMTDSASEIRFDKNNPYRDPINSTELTIDQVQILDSILYDNREKFAGSSYSKRYDPHYDPSRHELDVDFIEKGSMVVRVMDKHNFYEAELMPTEYLNEAEVGLLTKLWIHISKAVKE